MPIKIKSQKDCLNTKVAIALPADLNEIDAFMRSSNATGTIVATYNQGGLMGVNMEQNKHMPAKDASSIREILGIGTRELECE